MTRQNLSKAREHEYAAEVARWCRHLADQRAGLCTDALSPQFTISEIILQTPSWPQSSDDSARRRMQDAVDEVCKRRRERVMADLGATEIDIDDRRLVYYPDYTDFCGLGIETAIVDGADTPAWDLWTATANHDEQFCIVSYVPSWFRARADHAISLSPTGALAWCDVDALSWEGGS